MKSKGVKITIVFTLFRTMTFFYGAKMAGLSPSDNMFTAMLL